MGALFCLILLASPARTGANDLAAKLHAYLAPLVQAKDFNGVVLIAKGDKVLVQRSYGLSSFELDAPLTMRSKFRIASITKTFTAAAIAILAERERVSYLDPLSKYIPDFPRGEKIQLRHLLAHSAGVANPDSSPCSGASLDDLVKELAGKDLAFPPGTRSRYSNGGYVLLARVIEQASGQTWEQFLRDSILVPLSLADTRADDQRAIIPARSEAYVPGPSPFGVLNAPCAGAWSAMGSGSLLSTAPDLYRWGRAVRNETVYRRSAIPYPYGWGVRKYFDRNVIEQSGFVSGAGAYLAVYLDEDLYVVVLNNVQRGALAAIGKGLAALALGLEPGRLMAPASPVDITASQRARWVGTFNNPEVGTVRIVSTAGGALMMRWCESCEPVYLTPTSPSELFNRQDSIALRLAGEGTIEMQWVGESETKRFVALPSSSKGAL